MEPFHNSLMNTVCVILLNTGQSKLNKMCVNLARILQSSKDREIGIVTECSACSDREGATFMET